jgi:hypothetical protein
VHNGAAATALLGALTGHPSLRMLCLSGDDLYRGHAPQLYGCRLQIITALATLIASNAPALAELDISQCNLDDAAMRPLLGALSYNTHLRVLRCGANALSDAFARDVLAHVVRMHRIECDAVPGRMPAPRR